ncbi:UNVERIFIED_CONTAM: hypothetical protein Slati_4125900 [Sesamum latifolium]|uniref:Reverse transcriptase domain-containing protein n=1 Tax=Sesamum latifolium TaxID=2727402 RepID=A0AAW2T7V8_9LAMI
MLVNDRWLDRWPNAAYTSLQTRTSDHSPLVLCGNPDMFHGNIFWFDNYLVASPDFIPSVYNVWRHNIVGTTTDVVTKKLKTLKQDARHDSLLLCLEHCRRILYLKTVKLEQIMLQQRAKLQWLKGGDQWSRIFFRKIATRRAATSISYYELQGRRSKLHFYIAEDKSPGLDGYSAGFFKVAWYIIGDQVTQVVLDFFLTGKLLKQVNATLLSLIPKVQVSTTMADFRPISCCNVLYKAITKIIVQRLSPILERLISPSQNAFIPGRSISDNKLLAQELFSGYNQQRPLRGVL